MSDDLTGRIRVVIDQTEKVARALGPRTTIVRCTADRTIVDLHASDHECPVEPGDGVHPVRTGLFNGNCPTLTAMAEGYGVPVDEPATTEGQ